MLCISVSGIATPNLNSVHIQMTEICSVTSTFSIYHHVENFASEMLPTIFHERIIIILIALDGTLM